MSAIDHIHVTCCHEGCSAIITFHQQEHKRLKRTHEWFGCPYGHQQHFAGKTEEEKRIERLEEQLAQAEKYEQQGYALADSMSEALVAVRRGAQVCPLGCGWHASRRLPGWPPDEEDIARFFDRLWTDLRDHLMRDHNATLAPIALLEAGQHADA